MADETVKNQEQGEEEDEVQVFTLTDENGEENDFELLLSMEVEGSVYYALAPVATDEKDDEDGQYVILKLSEENGEQILITIDDDDEFDRIADMFDDALFGEIDHDDE